MKRRLFLKISTASVIPLLGLGCNPANRNKLDIIIRSDMDFGHLLFESQDYQKGMTFETDTLIVGGGISGMAAAVELQNKDFILCELSDSLGGTSAALQIGDGLYAQGAHYDLAYPENYGNQGLNFLKNLDIIQWNSLSRLWEFKDKRFVISSSNESRCFIDGEFRENVLPNGNIKNSFISLMQEYKGKMVMPTPSIDEGLLHLNEITFYDFLVDKINLDSTFKAGLDYNMRDDYGGPSDMVSALAGIHYYECRPYYTHPVELFSPPMGNYYFIDKMSQKIQPGKVKTGQMVFRISEDKEGFTVQVLDRNTRSIHTYQAKSIIYAGNKHALKYIYPQDADLFKDNIYAPWVIMNIQLDGAFSTQTSFWQNEMISSHPSLIGFVDSESQFQKPGNQRVLTAYFCLPHEQRIDLKDLQEKKYEFTLPVLDLLSEYFGINIVTHVQKVYIKVLGHAMAIPTPYFLFNDKNKMRKNHNLVYAGVDNSRLPLFFEALDSGIQAARLLKNSIS